MSDATVHPIPIVSLDDPAYAHLARRVVLPAPDPAQRSKWFPALAGFNIGSGSDVDVSYLYSFRDEAQSSFDRHLHTEEVFIPLDGDLCLPLAPCADAADLDEEPDPGAFVAVVVPHGEALILRPNVWHNGGWPLDPGRGVRYLMLLSGHRPGPGRQGYVDFVNKRLEGAAILPHAPSRPSR